MSDTPIVYKPPLIKIELRFHPNEKCFPCKMDYTLPDNDKYPIYYNYDEDYTYYGKKYKSVTYFIYYQENLAIGLNTLFPYSTLLGYHPIDRELIKVLYDMDSLIPEYVFFSAHAQEGRYYKYSDCNLTKEDKTLIVYVSLNSHACRKDPGVYWRVLGLANDICSDKGRKIRPEYIEFNMVYNAQNREVFGTPWNSFFLPYYQRKLSEMKKEQKIEEEKNNR